MHHFYATEQGTFWSLIKTGYAPGFLSKFFDFLKYGSILWREFAYLLFRCERLKVFRRKVFSKFILFSLKQEMLFELRSIDVDILYFSALLAVLPVARTTGSILLSQFAIAVDHSTLSLPSTRLLQMLTFECHKHSASVAIGPSERSASHDLEQSSIGLLIDSIEYSEFSSAVE